MAALNEGVKIFVVQSLACFDTPVQVAASVKQQFGVDVSLPQLTAYNPASKSGQRMSDKLKTLFAETRKKFLEDTSEIPIAHQTYRLRALNRMMAKAEQQGNTVLAAQLIEQASKEIGGAFTNKQKVEHSGEVKTPTLNLVLNGPLTTSPTVAGVSQSSD